MYMNEQENPVQETPAPSGAYLDDEELKGVHVSANTPKENAIEEADLSDEELDAVSGGEGTTLELPGGGYDCANA
jgi:hypothetical protein